MNLDYLQDLKMRVQEHNKTDWEQKEEGKKYHYLNYKKMIILKINTIEEYNAKIIKYVEDIKEYIEGVKKLGITFVPKGNEEVKAEAAQNEEKVAEDKAPEPTEPEEAPVDDREPEQLTPEPNEPKKSPLLP